LSGLRTNFLSFDLRTNSGLLVQTGNKALVQRSEISSKFKNLSG